MTFKTLRTLIYIVIFTLVLLGALYFISSFSKPNSKISLNQTAVITEIQTLAKLETASFTIEKIIEGGTQGNIFQNILYGDKILLIAHANVVAGFDLSKLKESDVKINGVKLEISLPPAEILYSRLDNEQTRVYDRKRGLLTKGDSQLESQARLAAEESIRIAACDGGILQVASDNGHKQIQTMFKAAGFDEVVVSVTAGECR